jgi:hypothetical protein
MIRALTLGAPLWLWGLVAAVGVPVAAHILSRRVRRSAVFPTLRFLRQAVDSGRQSVRLRDRALLILRCLVLTMLVAAFTRPQWLPRAWAVGRGRGVDAVFLLDRSASMARIEHGASLFDAAKANVIAAISSLDPATDRALVVLVDARPTMLVPQPTAGLAHLIELTRQVPQTHERGDLDGAISLVARLREAEPQEARSRGLVFELHSDMQNTQWPWGSAAMPPPLNESGAAWHLRPVGHAQANLAIRHPVLSPAQPIVGQPATLSAEAANFSDREVQSLVTLTVEQSTLTAPVHTPPRGVTAVTFQHTPGKVGASLWALHIEDQSAALDLDDQSGLFVDVAPARHVALVTRVGNREQGTGNRNDTLATTSAAYFVERALLPDDDAAGRYSGVVLERWTPDDLATRLRPLSGHGDGARFVVIVEAGKIDPAGLAALRDYLNSGGAVLWVIDSPGASTALHQFAALDPKADLSPLRLPPGAELLWRQGVGLPGAEGLGMAQGQFADPILNIFEGAARAGLLRQRFKAMPTCALAQSGQALLTLTDGSPLLAAQWVGFGRLAVLAAAIDPEQSSFVRDPSFVPLLHQLMHELTPGAPAAPNPHPDRGMTTGVYLDGSYQSNDLVVRGPKGSSSRGGGRSEGTGDTPAVVSRIDARRTLVQLGPFSHVGPYSILRADTGALLGGVYVDVNPLESDLSAMPTGAADSASAAPTASVGAQVRPAAIDLWPWALLAAAILLGMEQVILRLVPMGEGEKPDRKAAPAAPTAQGGDPLRQQRSARAVVSRGGLVSRV